jgi:hypothetical protein
VGPGFRRDDKEGMHMDLFFVIDQFKLVAPADPS